MKNKGIVFIATSSEGIARGLSGLGKTLQESFENLVETDSMYEFDEEIGPEDCKFYEAHEIQVVIVRESVKVLRKA